MTRTLPVTILLEGAVGLVYSLWRGKPIPPILVTSAIANLLTQSLLWVVLNIFFQHYLVTLLIAEFLIWIIEGMLLYGVRGNRLKFKEAIVLSLAMNLSSFGIGWFLPV